MFWNTAKIIEALATIKADTKNHKEDLKEMKDNFDKHVDKEDQQARQTQDKIGEIHGKISDWSCPHDEKILKLERRIHDSTKQDQKRRINDMETKTQDIKDRAAKDEEIAKEISSLKSTRKYNYASISGIYIILGIILKKIFTS